MGNLRLHYLALVKPFGHVFHLIRTIYRSFEISYFSTDVFLLRFFPAFCSRAEGTMNEVVDSLYGSLLLFSMDLLPP